MIKHGPVRPNTPSPDYLKGADAQYPTAVTPDATARHRPLRLPVMGLPPCYTVANRPLRPTFSNLDSALCTHVPPNMPVFQARSRRCEALGGNTPSVEGPRKNVGRSSRLS